MSNGNLRGNSPNSGNSSDSSNEWRTGYIQGNTFSNKEVKYRIANGRAIFEGDIILAKNSQEIERLSHKLVKGVGMKGEMYRWPRGEIPYMIDPNLTNPGRVTSAIQHWEERTPIRLIRRTDSNARYYPNYVSFIQYVPRQDEKPEEVYHCTSPVGMYGGEQNITMSDQCSNAAAIHEIGHTVGLWHEQSRRDRDTFVRIVWDNIENGRLPDGSYDQRKDMTHNFEQHITDGDDIGQYDYCSIMHYFADAFSKNGQPTIEVRRSDLPCGNTNRLGRTEVLSDGDIAAVNEMYESTAPTIAQNADGRLEAFMLGSDSQLYHKQQTSTNSTAWDQQWSSLGLKESLQSRWGTRLRPGAMPAIVRSSDGRLDVFCLIYGRVFAGDYPAVELLQSWLPAPLPPPPPPQPGTVTMTQEIGWSHVESIEAGGGDFDGDPVVGSNADGSLAVFVAHEEYSSNLFTLHLYSTTTALHYLQGEWSPNRRPAVAQNADGRLEVFMVGLNGQLYHRWQTSSNDSGKWSDGWTPLGGQFAGDPVLARNADGRLEVFVVASQDRALYHLWQTSPNNSSRWTENGTSLGGDWSHRRRPAVARNRDGRLEVFMVGLNGQLYRLWQTSSNDSSQWSKDWVPLGQEQWPLSSNPTVARNADGRLEVFMVGSDRQLRHKWQDSEWSEWTSLGGQFP